MMGGGKLAPKKTGRRWEVHLQNKWEVETPVTFPSSCVKHQSCHRTTTTNNDDTMHMYTTRMMVFMNQIESKSTNLSFKINVSVSTMFTPCSTTSFSFRLIRQYYLFKLSCDGDTKAFPRKEKTISIS